MTLHHLTADLPPGFVPALARFEREFSYPLGPQARFHISHGERYLPFFQAMGRPEIILLEEDSEILGCLARVERRLRLDRGTPLDAHYLCDLKLRPSARGTTVLPRLIREAKRRIELSGSARCYCIVMDGTGKLPTDYTGRLGVPRFEKLAEIVILRLETLGTRGSARAVSERSFAEVSRLLPRAGYSACDADRIFRSAIEPIHLVTPDGDACGIIEDTRKGKRLFREDGDEMLSAHLSGLAFASAGAAALLLRGAAFFARGVGLPALFAALPASKAAEVIACLGSESFTVAPAAVYGHALESGRDWWIDTAEI
jgi:hypothetical protein